MPAFDFSGYSSSNKSSFSSADDNRQNYQSRTSTTAAPKTKTYTNVNPTNDKVTTSTIKQSTLNKYKTKPKKKTTFTPDNSGEGAGAENVLKGNAVPGGVGGPTKAEVSQSEAANAEAANADADTEANRLLKIKKKGRSRSIMTSAKGVTKNSADYSLGKKSLLGRV